MEATERNWEGVPEGGQKTQVTDTNNDHFFAGLRIIGDAVDFDEISKQLGLTPTSTMRRGEPMTPLDEAASNDVWTYRAEVPREKPLADHLAALKRLLDPHSEYLRSLARKWKVSVYCSYQTEFAQGGFVIPTNLAEMFSDYGIDLEIAILSWGHVLDDENEGGSSSHEAPGRAKRAAQQRRQPPGGRRRKGGEPERGAAV